MVDNIEELKSKIDELNNKLEELQDDYIRLLEYTKSTIGKQNEYKQAKSIKKLKSTLGLRQVYVCSQRKRNNAFECTIYNVSNIYKELKLIDIIEHNSECFKYANKTILEEILKKLLLLRQMMEVFEKYNHSALFASSYGYFNGIRWCSSDCNNKHELLTDGISMPNNFNRNSGDNNIPIITDVIRISTSRNRIPSKDVQMIESQLFYTINDIIMLKIKLLKTHC